MRATKTAPELWMSDREFEDLCKEANSFGPMAGGKFFMHTTKVGP